MLIARHFREEFAGTDFRRIGGKKLLYQAVQIYIATFNNASISTEMFLRSIGKNTIAAHKQRDAGGNPLSRLLDNERSAIPEGITSHDNAINTRF